MKELIEELIYKLRKRVGGNLHRIRMSEELIKEILEEIDGKERDDKLNERFTYNKELLDENSDSINMQLALIRYLSKYRELMDQELTVSNGSEKAEMNSGRKIKEVQNFNLGELSSEDCLKLTLAGELDYNVDHPFFLDEDFQEKLISHYASIEDYEMCKMIKDIHR